MSKLKKALVALLVLGMAAGAGLSLSSGVNLSDAGNQLDNRTAGNEFDG